MNLQLKSTAFEIEADRPVEGDIPHPHNAAAEAVVSGLSSHAIRGLSSDEAKRRLDQYGPNQLKAAPETPWW
jgi:hypothetical protein